MKTKRRKRKLPQIRLAGAPILKAVCTPVVGEDVTHIIRDMMFILTSSKHGVGLSANQAGYAKRVIIVKHNGEFIPMIDPIIWKDESVEMVEDIEGCLSYPGKSAKVARAKVITVDYYTPDNEFKSIRCEDMMARIVQHEIDHLNGKCIVGE